MSDFIRIFDFWKKILVLVCKIHIFGWSVKYTFQQFQIYKCFWLEIFTSDRCWPYKAIFKISSWSRDWLVFYRPVRKLPTIRHFEWSSGPINLKFSPNVYINKINKCAKFQVDRVIGSYFTDQTGIEKTSVCKIPPSHVTDLKFCTLV